MKYRLNQKGFAHLALVLLALVIVVAAFAGFKVYQDRQDKIDAAKTSTAVIQTSSGQSAQVPTSMLPLMN